MRSLLVTAVVVSAAIALGGCPGKPPQHVPGPQSRAALAAAAAPRAAATIRRGWACSTAVSAGDSSTRCLRAETREVDGMNSGKPSGSSPMAILSRAAGTPAEGAETT